MRCLLEFRALCLLLFFKIAKGGVYPVGKCKSAGKVGLHVTLFTMKSVTFQ